MNIKVAWTILTFALVAGCNTTYSHIGDEDPLLGEAVKFNAAVQTVNPTPVYSASSAQPGDSAAKGQAAVKRYRTDAIKPVETIGTTQGSGGSGGAGPK